MISRKSIYKKILHEYDLKQLKSQRNLDKKREYIYTQSPEVKSIDSELTLTGIRVAKLIATSPAEQEAYLEKLKKHNDKLIRRKNQLLEELGLDTTYLDLAYECSKCNDTGYIGKEKCSCFQQKLIDYAYSQSNIKKTLTEENFNTFDFNFYANEPFGNEPQTPYDNMKLIYEHARRYVQQFPEGQNLLYYGQAGMGKTFLCNCIAKSILDKGFTVLYFTAFDLFNLLERYKFKKDHDDHLVDYFNAIFDCQLLIIDDLGSEMNTGFTSSELFNCINSRILDHKSTIISTNLSIADIQENYSDRISSRIIGNYRLYKFYGSDIRIQKKIHKKSN